MGNSPKAITSEQRDAWLRSDDNALLADCHVDTYRASGPGGQKRNKTSSAVRLRHIPTGLIVISEDGRSQHANKRTALDRLRLAIAVEIRPMDETDSRDAAEFLKEFVQADGKLRISTTNTAFPLVVARILDDVYSRDGSVRELAQSAGTSASQVVRLLSTHRAALAALNALREKRGLPRFRTE